MIFPDNHASLKGEEATTSLLNILAPVFAQPVAATINTVSDFS